MFDPIVYIELGLVVVFFLMQKVYSERFRNTFSNIGLGAALSMLGLVIFL